MNIYCILYKNPLAFDSHGGLETKTRGDRLM